MMIPSFAQGKYFKFWCRVSFFYTCCVFTSDHHQNVNPASDECQKLVFDFVSSFNLDRKCIVQNYHHSIYIENRLDIQE